MTLDPAFVAGVLGVVIGTASAAVCSVVGMNSGYSRFVACYLLFSLAGGGGMGIAGGALARLSGCPQWADVVSGVLGASAVIGFDTAIQRLLRKP